MRVMLAVGAVLSLAGGAVRAVYGDWPVAIGCAVAFWACSLLFVAHLATGRRRP